MNVIRTKFFAVTLGFIFLLCASCHSREKPRNRYDAIDGGYIMREECNVPSMNCHNDCLERKASLGCTGCCMDQRFLCDTGQTYDFEYCKGAR